MYADYHVLLGHIIVWLYFIVTYFEKENTNLQVVYSSITNPLLTIFISYS